MPCLKTLALGGLSVCWLALQTVSVLAETARFTVRNQVVNADVPAFTATAASLGNGSEFMSTGGGFEPSNVRTMLVAGQDSPDMILAAPQVISAYDSWPQGTFDGADVEVMRIVDGKLQTIREDRVAQGGFNASGWTNLTPTGQILSPATTRYMTSWDSFNRLGAPWYYTVRAVDGAGRLSPPSAVASLVAPAKPGKPGAADKASLVKRDLQDAPAKLPAPENLQVKLTMSQTALLSWDPVPGAAGYAVFRSALPPDQIRGYGIRLEWQGAPIRAGDMVFLRKKFSLPRRDQVATGRVWSIPAVKSTFGIALLSGLPGDPDMPEVRLVPHPAGTPVPDAGETYLEADLKDGESLAIGGYNHSGKGQRYYPVLDPRQTYRFEIWMRGEGDVSATFRLNGPQSKTPGLPATAHPGKDWQKFVLDFRVPSVQSGTQAGQMQLVLSGRGRIDLDNYRIYRADTPYMDLLPEDREALSQSGMEALRSHMFIKSGTQGYDLAQLTAPAGLNPRESGQTLDQFLKICAATGVNPWIQLDPPLSRAEWLGLVEYLAAPFDPAKDDPAKLPWAAKRAAQGHPEPWTDTFPRIYFEIGNETWNPLFRPWNFPSMQDGGRLNWSKYGSGDVYGLYQAHVLSVMRESPWWDRLQARMKPVIGGWQINNYGFDALKQAPDAAAVTVADYIGGWDSGEGPVRPTPEGYASVMAFTPQMTMPVAARAHETLRDMGLSGKVALGTYEAGPGYALNGLNGRQVSREQRAGQEKVMKSAAAGAATLDAFLARVQAGDRVQNYFLFGRGMEWRSHALWQDGGQAYPSWAWLALFNHVGRGDALAVDTREVPRMDLPEMGRRKPMADAPMAAAYAARQGDRLTVTVISRLVPGAGSDGRLSVDIDLPISGARKLTRYRASGDYRAENTASEQTRILSEAMPVPQEPGTLKIADFPPASAEVFVYEDVTFR